MGLPTLYRRGYLLSNTDIVPIEHIIKWFIDRIDTYNSVIDRLLILKSSTGSGKSTVIPPEFFYKVTNGKYIVCTQPRILNAMSIPHQIIPYYTDKPDPLILGRNIGFQTGFMSKYPSNPGIVFATIGVLYSQLSYLSDAEIIQRYSCIIIDEAHERSTISDMTLFMLKRFLTRNVLNPKCPFVVVMSATIDLDIYVKYFEVPIDSNTMTIQGETYPIDEHFASGPTNDNIYKVATSLALQFHKNNNDDTYRDILIFVTGLSDIDQLKKNIMQLNASDDTCKRLPIAPIEVSSDSVKRNPREIFGNIKDIKMKLGNKIVIPNRRVFIGTNVAETGITIDSLGCVIDLGFYKSSELNPIREVRLFVSKPVTQSMHTQRKGRVGRLAPGECYNAFTEEVYDMLLPQQFSDIIKEDITLELLNLFVFNHTDIDKQLSVLDNLNHMTKLPYNVFDTDLLEHPSVSSVHYSLNKLYYLGFIDSSNCLTRFGYIASRFRQISPEIITMILWGYLMDVAIIDLVHIAVMLNVRSPHGPPKHPETDIYMDDFMMLPFSFNNYLSNLKYVSPSIEDVFVMREDLIIMLISNGFNPYVNYDRQLINNPTDYNYVSRLKRCIYEGFKLNILRKMPNGTYETRLGVPIRLQPSYTDTFYVYDEITFKGKSNLLTYTVGHIAKIEGFITIDYLFDIYAFE